MMDSDEDNEIGVVVINSDKPILSNRKNIDLPPLPPNAYKESSMKQTSKKKKRNGLLKLFQSKSNKEETVKFKISVPYGFNHISHADSRAGFDVLPTTSSASAHLQDIPEMSEYQNQRNSGASAPMVKAFVTDAIPQTQQDHISRSSSAKRSSIGSSTYSSTRVTSTSTMATSLLNDSSVRSLSKLTSLEKSHLKHKYSKSDASEINVEFLRNYQFPTLLEEQSLVQVTTPDLQTGKIDKFQWETPDNSIDLLETMLLDNVKSLPRKSTTPKNSHKRNSDSMLTPILKPSEYLDTPRTRRSVDDVLLCYLQPSEAGSLAETSSEFSFARNSTIYYKPS